MFENLLVAAVHGRGRPVARRGRLLRRHPRAHRPDARAPTRAAGSLTLLERKRLEMARALATAPKLLLLDEIAGGLTESECHELVATIKGIRAGGMTIVWIEHIVHALLAVVDRLIVLNFGRKIAEGQPRAVMGSPRCGRSTWGWRHERVGRNRRQPYCADRRVDRRNSAVSRAMLRPTSQAREVLRMTLLETRGLTAFYGDFQALYGIDLRLEEGETLAIIGANGAGKSTFLKTVAGLLPAAPESVHAATAGRSADCRRPRSCGSASRWCRRGGGSFPRSASRRTC